MDESDVYIDEKDITILIPNFYELPEKDYIKLLENLYRKTLICKWGYLPNEYEKITKFREG